MNHVTFFLIYICVNNSGTMDELRWYNRDAMTGHVVGGVEVSILMYPHSAQIFSGGTVCGGSIISDRVILTAGHCLFTPNGTLINTNKIYVLLGSGVLTEGIKYDVCKVVPHELYKNQEKDNFYYYDLGLVLLSKQIKFGPTVRKVKLAKNKHYRNERNALLLAGFGGTKALGGVSPILKATRMHYIDSHLCNESQSYREYMNVPNHMFCMIGERWTSDCYGDSGSGIIWKRLLVGIVSTGRDTYCGSDILPSMYTDIVYFRRWIVNKVMELEKIPTSSC